MPNMNTLDNPGAKRVLDRFLEASKGLAPMCPMSPVPLAEMPTPCLLLDYEKMVANVQRMRDILKDVHLRPHLKTCRSLEVAACMMEGRGEPCTVATMGEAEVMHQTGASDILLAVGIRPNLFARAQSLMQDGVDLKVVLDSPAMARELANYANGPEGQGIAFSVLLEIDTDGHRAGFRPDDPNLVLAADILREGGQKVTGVLAHAGGSYACENLACIRRMADEEARLAVAAAETLRAHGHPCPMVSVGSTPTAVFGRHREGVTEVRAGVYVYMDLVMAGLGVCKVKDIAISVLASVIGGFPEKGELPARFFTDSGWSSISSDRGLARLFPTQGYGLLCDIEGNVLPGVHLYDLNQEHGMAAVPGEPGPRVRRFLKMMGPGTMVRVLPNHACNTAMQHEVMYVARDGMAVGKVALFRGW